MKLVREMSEVRVLVVEDEFIVAEDIRASLRKFGYTTGDSVASGEEALEAVGKHRPDVILMDIQLKGEMNGIEAAKQIQADFNIPVIYLTAFADEKTIREVTSSHPFGYILKPVIDERILRSAIEVALFRYKMETELIRAKEKAETANHARNKFITNISHELRTPLNGVIGMTELVLCTDLTEDQNECLQMVQTSARSLLAIINDVLEFAAIEGNDVKVETLEMNLNRVVHEAAETFVIKAEDKSLNLEVKIDADIPAMVEGDPMRLRQIIFILVGNAIKFTEKGGVSVKVKRNNGHTEMEARETKGIWIDFCVDDSGIGIPEDKLTDIFNSFTQADGSYTRRYNGTGLGLTICAGLVKLLGGELKVESTEGKGSSFSFSLPFGEYF